MDNRFRFKKGEIEALPIPLSGKRATYYDEEVKKLALRVSAGGAKVFYVVKRADSGMAWVKLGTFPEMTVELARKEAQRVLGEFAKGGNPAEAKREERQKQTFGEAFTRYMEMHAGPQQVKTAADITAMWQRFLGHLPDEPAKKHGRKRTKHPAGVDWENRKLDQIDTADIRALHAGIGKSHRTMANRVVELISSIYGRAIEWGYRGANPANGIKPFKEKKRDRFIQPNELPRFFQALAEDLSDDFKHFVLLALLTGARRENILAARWEDFNLVSMVWRIPDTKNDEPVLIPLVPEAVQILEARGAKISGFVFPAESASGHLTPPKKRWAQLLDRDELAQLTARIQAAGGEIELEPNWSLERRLAKARQIADELNVDLDGTRIADLRIHDLRRSLGSWQAITGASLAIIGKSLGHKSADATMIYARLHMDPVRASVTTATSAMLEAAGVKDGATVTPIKGKTAA